MPLVLNQHFHRHNGRPGPRIRGTAGDRGCSRVSPRSVAGRLAARSDSRHEYFYPAGEKLSFVKEPRDHQIVANPSDRRSMKARLSLGALRNAKWLSEPGIRRLVPRDQHVRTGAGAGEPERTQGNPRFTQTDPP